MSASGLSSYQDELLEILAEELAELIQEKSKIFRFGLNNSSHHVKDKSHLECLIQEMGDVICMIEMVRSNLNISKEELEYAKQKKAEKVVKWMNNKRE